MGCRSVGELQQRAVDLWMTVTAVGCRSVGDSYSSEL